MDRANLDEENFIIPHDSGARGPSVPINLMMLET